VRFDAYAGTIREVEFDYVAQALSSSLGGIICKGQAKRRYGEVLDIELGGRQAAWVGWDTGNGTVYFEGKGETSPLLVKAVRTHFPGHTVARGDVCEDYDGQGVFERLVGIVRQTKGAKVWGGFVALPDDPSEGKTYAAGKRGAVAYCRIYEAGKMAERAHLGRPHWARAECETRPHTALAKRAAATMTPLQFWGLAAWSHRVGEVLANVDIPRFLPESRSYSQDKTTLYLARTFRRHWEEKMLDLGDWECIGREMQSVWAEDDAQAEATARRDHSNHTKL
jgi:hypothetical protein